MCRGLRPRCVQHFGEGLAVVGDTLLQLTWQEKVVNRFRLPDLSLVDSRPLPCASSASFVCYQGWGLAFDGQRLYLTDSTDKLFTLDPQTLEPLGPPQQIYDRQMACTARALPRASPRAPRRAPPCALPCAPPATPAGIVASNARPVFLLAG